MQNLCFVSGFSPRPDTINTRASSRPSVILETTRPGNEAISFCVLNGVILVGTFYLTYSVVTGVHELTPGCNHST